MGEPSDGPSRSGLLYGVAAYGWWGFMPLYFSAVSAVGPRELLAHRVVWSALLLLVVLTVFRRWGALRGVARRPRTMALLVSSAVLIAVNWYVFIYAALNGQQIQASLGYFMLPLVNVAAGLLIFGERLRPLQVVAVVLGSAGVTCQVAGLGSFPTISLTLAVSFCLYGVARKQAAVEPVVGLAVETLLLAPVAFVFLLSLLGDSTMAFGSHGRAYDGLIACSGIITTVPLVCFAAAVRRLELVTVGFLQYLSPSIQLAIAVFVSGEAFTRTHALSFAFIWAALALFAVDAVRAARRPALGPRPFTR